MVTFRIRICFLSRHLSDCGNKIKKVLWAPYWEERTYRNSKCHCTSKAKKSRVVFKCSALVCPGKIKVKNETQPWVLIMYEPRPVSFCLLPYSLGHRHPAICQLWPTGGMSVAACQRLQEDRGRGYWAGDTRVERNVRKQMRERERMENWLKKEGMSIQWKRMLQRGKRREVQM